MKMNPFSYPLTLSPIPSPEERGTGAEAPGLRLIIIFLCSTFVLFIPLGGDST